MIDCDYPVKCSRKMNKEITARTKRFVLYYDRGFDSCGRIAQRLFTSTRLLRIKSAYSDEHPNYVRLATRRALKDRVCNKVNF